MADSPGEVTLLLAEMKLGHKDALSKLIPLVYKELRRLDRTESSRSGTRTSFNEPHFCDIPVR